MITLGTIAMGPEVAIGTLEKPTFFHMLAGYLVFVVALAGMLGVGRILDTDWSRVRRRLLQPSAPAAPKPRPANPGPRPRPYDEY